MAMAKPVLTTAVGMNLEYIVDGQSGVLAPPGNEAHFESELERLSAIENGAYFWGTMPNVEYGNNLPGTVRH